MNKTKHLHWLISEKQGNRIPVFCSSLNAVTNEFFENHLTRCQLECDNGQIYSKGRHRLCDKLLLCTTISCHQQINEKLFVIFSKFIFIKWLNKANNSGIVFCFSVLRGRILVRVRTNLDASCSRSRTG